jgi:ABC-2 type transport system ATP-binding protein
VVDDGGGRAPEYLGAKIRVQFHKLRAHGARGVTMYESGYEWKLQIDTAITPVRVVTAAVLDAGSVADIAVEDPPLEEVIARIYCESRKEVPI